MACEFGDKILIDGGFDLILGNPPWIKPEWHDKDILSEFYPKIVTSGLKADRIKALKSEF